MKILGIETSCDEGNWVCIGDDKCKECKKYEAVLDGKGEFQFSDDDFKKDIYFLETQ